MRPHSSHAQYGTAHTHSHLFQCTLFRRPSPLLLGRDSQRARTVSPTPLPPDDTRSRGAHLTQLPPGRSGDVHGSGPNRGACLPVGPRGCGTAELGRYAGITTSLRKGVHVRHGSDACDVPGAGHGTGAVLGPYTFVHHAAASASCLIPSPASRAYRERKPVAPASTTSVVLEKLESFHAGLKDVWRLEQAIRPLEPIRGGPSPMEKSSAWSVPCVARAGWPRSV